LLIDRVLIDSHDQIEVLPQEMDDEYDDLAELTI